MHYFALATLAKGWLEMVERKRKKRGGERKEKVFLAWKYRLDEIRKKKVSPPKKNEAASILSDFF